MHLLQSGQVVVKVLDYIQSSHEIERIIGKRQMLGLAFSHILETALAAELKGLWGHVDAFGFSKFRQQLKIGTRAAANIQDPLALLGISRDRLQEAGNN